MIGNPIGYPIGGVINAGGDLNASLVVTLDDVTLSSTAALDIAATASVTLDDATVSSTATLLITADESTTLDDATVVSSGTVLVTADLAVTLDDATVVSDAVVEIHADLAVTLDDATAVADSTVINNGYLAVTLDDVTLFCDGNIRLPNTDADGGDYGSWRKPKKIKFAKEAKKTSLEQAILKATAPPPEPLQYTPDEWIALFNALAGPAPDYAAPLTNQIIERAREEEDIELLLLGV